MSEYSVSSLPPLFFEIFSNLGRQGPGDFDSTRAAFQLATSDNPGCRILDLGCGTGLQTLALAEIAPNATIHSIDIHAPFIDELNQRIRERGLADRVRACVGDMGKVVFPAHSVDVIWCEGAIYHLGIGPALRAWRGLLAPKGRIAFTEVAWLTSTRPAACTEFWMHEYPDIRTIDENLALIHDAGYASVGHFVIPDAAWWEQFYNPLQRNVARLREQRRGFPEDLKLIERVQQEIDVRREFSEHYGYVFFVVEPERT